MTLIANSVAKNTEKKYKTEVKEIFCISLDLWDGSHRFRKWRKHANGYTLEEL